MPQPLITSPPSAPPARNSMALWAMILGLIDAAIWWSIFWFPTGSSPSVSLLLAIALWPVALVVSSIALMRRGRKAMAITGLVASLSVPLIFYRLTQTDATPRLTAAYTTATKSHLADLQKALTAFHADLGRYPTTAEGLDALIHAPPDTSTHWHGPYADSAFKYDPAANDEWDTWDTDAWEHPLFYQSPGTTHPESFDLTAPGRDGELHTSDDITSQ